MTGQRDQDQVDVGQAERDAAADQAVALVAASYLFETRGRPLNRRLRAEQDRAERLARYLSRQAEGGRRR
jgi:hypothetical protein